MRHRAGGALLLVEADSLGHRQQAAFRTRPSELRTVRTQDEAFELRATALPVADLSRARFALDCPPEAPGPHGVPALRGEDGHLGGGEQHPPPVTEVTGEL